MIDWLIQHAWLQLWQVTLLVILVGLIGRLLDRRAPELMGWLWKLVAIKAITPPIWASSFGLFGWWNYQAIVPSTTPSITVSVIGDSAQWVPFALLLAWASGVVLFAMIAVVKTLRLRRELNRSLVPSDYPLKATLDALATELRLPFRPRLAISTTGLGPAVCGLTRSTVVFPQALVDEVETPQIRSILMHELLHVRRGDTWTAMLHVVVRGIWWFHPLVWWALNESDKVAERCVDRNVSQQLGDACSDYARGLLRVLELRAEFAAPTGFVGLCSARLTADRIYEVFTAPAPQSRLRKRAAQAARLLCVAVMAIVVLPALPPVAPGYACTPPAVISADGVAAGNAPPTASTVAEHD